MPKLNEEKTDLIDFAPRSGIKNLSETSLLFDQNIIQSVQIVRNFGAFFDQLQSFEKQCNTVSKICYLQIRKIWRIRHYLTDTACKTLVHSLVTLRLDYGNALLYNINSTNVVQLQRVKNTADVLLKGQANMNIQPILFDSHWLPVMNRVHYKLCVYVYTAFHSHSWTSICLVTAIGVGKPFKGRTQGNSQPNWTSQL